MMSSKVTWCLALLVLLPALSLQDDNEFTDPPVIIEYDDDNEFTDPPVIIEYDDDNEFTDPPVIIEYDEMDREEEERSLNMSPKDFLETNPDQVDGVDLFEGDILLTPEQRSELLERKAIAFTSYRWPDATDGYPFVPYAFADTSVDRAAVKVGIDHWMEHTCIKFSETTNMNQPYLSFFLGGGCYSNIGRITSNGQKVSIGNGCSSLGVVAHEIGHAMGFFHEQSRPDRDTHVIINDDNIQSGKENNFNTYSTSYINNMDVTYDYGSDMHYGAKGFTNNGKTTISTKDPLVQGLIGQRAGLSHRDKLLANKMYNCIDKWMAKCSMTSDPCKNEGYLGADCTCVCPPGTSGNNCETVTGGYYDKIIGSCSEKITTEGKVESPNYPNNYPTGTQCAKWIVAPACHVPKITFTYFRMYDRRSYCADQSCCYFDSLEIRTANTYTGDVFCSQDIAAGRSFTATGQDMVLFLYTRTNYYKGFSADITFVPQEGCQATTNAPVTTAATTKAPVTTAATTKAPVTTAATTKAPVTTAATTKAPVTTAATTKAPVTTAATTNVPQTTDTDYSTTTAKPTPKCTIESFNGKYYWSSPSYGVSNYPDNFKCSLSASSSTRIVTTNFAKFELQPKIKRKCVDYVNVELPYSRSKILCGKLQTTQRAIQTVGYLRMSFVTNGKINKPGYNATIEFQASTCHQKIFAQTVGETGTISTPRFNKPHASNYDCLYTIYAPAGRQVKMDYLTVKTRKSRGCKVDWALVNGASQINFPPTTSKIMCGKRMVTNIVPSTTGKMYVAYKGSAKRSRGIRFKYTII